MPENFHWAAPVTAFTYQGLNQRLEKPANWGYWPLPRHLPKDIPSLNLRQQYLSNLLIKVRLTVTATRYLKLLTRLCSREHFDVEVDTTSMIEYRNGLRLFDLGFGVREYSFLNSFLQAIGQNNASALNDIDLVCNTLGLQSWRRTVNLLADVKRRNIQINTVSIYKERFGDTAANLWDIVCHDSEELPELLDFVPLECKGWLAMSAKIASAICDDLFDPVTLEPTTLLEELCDLRSQGVDDVVWYREAFVGIVAYEIEEDLRDLYGPVRGPKVLRLRWGLSG